MSKKYTITPEEIEALQKVVDYAMIQEYEHCQELLSEDEEVDPDDVPDNGHIYYQLDIIDKLLNRIKDEGENSKQTKVL